MAGPAIRAMELARVLAHHCRVTLAAPGPNRLEDPRLEFLEATPKDFDRLLAALQTHDVVVAQQLPAQLLRYVQKLPIRYVADLYNPLMIELLEALADAGAPREQSLARRLTKTVLAQCAAADFVICASEKQRDLWIGALLAQRLIDPARYDSDASLRSLIDVVPFGVPAEPPSDATGGAIRARFPAIGADDEIVLWNGGIWRWLDAPTAIRGMALLAARRPGVRLVFMGGSANVAAQEASAEAREVARELGVLGSLVFFNEDWVPYAERADWLLDAGCALSTHREHLETRFAFRTRLLDCL
jgi:glycosyltransferase involved in cell wall biosynthesis